MSSHRINQKFSMFKICYIYLICIIFSENFIPRVTAFPQAGFMTTLKKRAIDALDEDDFTLERKGAFDQIEGDGFGFQKRALFNLEGDNFGGLRKRTIWVNKKLQKRALDMLEGDGFGLEKKRKRALDALKSSGFELDKRTVSILSRVKDIAQPVLISTSGAVDRELTNDNANHDVQFQHSIANVNLEPAALHQLRII